MNVNIISRERLDKGSRNQQPEAGSLAQVMTYRAPQLGELTLTENPSPNFGSQSPFHQRYSHYRQHGFAGKGATSSWARNPKYAYLEI
jgi:hypothetical protein